MSRTREAVSSEPGPATRSGALAYVWLEPRVSALSFTLPPAPSATLSTAPLHPELHA
ncbi:hypothetical protein IG631_11418 [Alternaria alternata]|nr:hypothetical protein IG631_11418 [Alternaria alternata]